MWARRLLRAGLEGRDGGAGVDNAGKLHLCSGASHRNLRCWLQGCGQQETSGSRAQLSLKIKGALSLSRGKRGMSHPYQLRAFLFHNSRIEPEPPFPRRTHGALCMVYLYLGFSIAPLYLAQFFFIFFFYTHARECARPHEHTQPYT